jgi:hypothetical protein
MDARCRAPSPHHRAYGAASSGATKDFRGSLNMPRVPSLEAMD